MSGAITENYGWESAEALESSGYIEPAIRRLVREGGWHNVVDVGCGNGALCGSLASDGVNIVGVDGDAAGIELARQRHPQLSFRVVNFADGPDTITEQGTQPFDCCVSTEVVEHLYAPHEFASFCFDSLRPGGTLIVTTPYHGYLKNLVLSLIDKWDDHHTPLWYGGHVKFWSKKTLTTLLEKAGFEVVGFEGVGRFAYLWKSMVLIARKPAR